MNIRLFQTFRLLSQEDQIRLLAITDALAPAQSSPQEDQPRSGEDSGGKNSLIEFSSYADR